MSFAGFVAAGIVGAIFVRGHKVAARRGAVFVDRAVSIFANTTREAHALVAMFDFGAFHAAISGVQIDGKFDGNLPDAIGLGLAPIESDAKVRAAGATAEARMLGRSLCHIESILCGFSPSNRNAEKV